MCARRLIARPSKTDTLQGYLAYETVTPKDLTVGSCLGSHGGPRRGGGGFLRARYPCINTNTSAMPRPPQEGYE